MAKKKKKDDNPKSKRGRPSFGSLHPFLRMGTVYEGAHGYKVVLATVPLYFAITPEIIKAAKPRSPKYCVVALALDAIFGAMISWLDVGSDCTTLWDDGAKIAIKFKTPPFLKKHISVFDKTGYWGLPPGIYPLSPAPTRVKKPKITVSKTVRSVSKVSVVVKTKTVVVIRKPARRRPRLRFVTARARIKD